MVPRKKVSDLNSPLLYKKFGYNGWSRTEVPLTREKRAASDAATETGPCSRREAFGYTRVGLFWPSLLHCLQADGCCRMSSRRRRLITQKEEETLRGE